MTDGKDGRRSFRIIESALVHYEIISDKQLRNGLEQWRIRAGVHTGFRSKILDLNSRLEEALFRVNNDHPAVSGAIRILNQKLDLIIETLPHASQYNAALMDRPAQVCELSSVGMAFGCDEELHTQDMLAIRFLLVSDSRYFDTFCKVVRVRGNVKEDGDNGRYPYQVAVEFAGMPDQEREILIQHLFSKQSEELRTRRKQAERNE